MLGSLYRLNHSNYENHIKTAVYNYTDYGTGRLCGTKEREYSYVSMQGSHAVIRMSQDFPSQIPSNRNTESDNAEITKGSAKKNGDIQFHMLIKGAEKWQDRELIIILYKNTNQCFVNINRGHSGQNIVNFKGYVYPLATE